MGINFPASPTVGDKYPTPSVAGIPTYTWDGEKWTTSGASIGQYVAKAGDTMSGDLTISKGGPRIYLTRADATNSSAIVSKVAANNRWVIWSGDTVVPETGGNTGSDFKITAYNDAGGYLTDPFYITRSTGLIAVAGDPTAALGVATKQYVDAGDVAGLAAAGMQINGGMEVDQPNAGAAIAVTAGTSQPNLVDGWIANKTGTNAFTVQQVASVFPGYNNELKLTVTTAQPTISSDVILLSQKIEGYRFAKAGWGSTAAQSVTLAFWAKSSVAGSVLLQLSDNIANAISQTVSIVSANVAQFITVIFPKQAAWAGSKTTGIGAFLNIEIAGGGFMNIVGTVGNTFEITGLVVLPGAVTITAAQSPLLMRSYDQELLTCKRYVQGIDGFSCAGFTPTATIGRFGISFPVIMRAAPAVTLKSAAAIAINTTTQTANTGSATISIPSGTTNSYTTLDVTMPGATFTAQGGCILYATAGALMFDARL